MKSVIILIVMIAVSEYAFSKETRIKVGMIDTGISFSQSSGKYLCEKGRKSAILFDSGIDRHGHGKNVFGLIAKNINPKTHCIISYKFWRKGMSNYDINRALITSLYQAKKDGVKYINMSLGGPESNGQEIRKISAGLKAGITYIVAAGNESNNLDKDCNYFPACYKEKRFKNNKNFIVVGARDVKKANYGSIISAYEKGYRVGIPVLTGTSQATATHTGKIIKTKSKKRGIIILRGN